MAGRFLAASLLLLGWAGLRGRVAAEIDLVQRS
jgi:hypothetical protein